jgi:pantoate--beta-alanine ligase
MGALHQGHLSLVKASQSQNQTTLVSLFVNPTQFNNPTDLAKYPRTEAEDLDLLSKARADYVLIPDPSEIYADGYKFKVSEVELSRILEGQHRPGHFDGVMTVVLKLLNLAQAEKAYFGEKDFQQYLLIKEMAQAFFIPTPTTTFASSTQCIATVLAYRNEG